MKPPSDVFRPRLPIDPFVDLDVDQEWFINTNLPALPPSVVLVLGGAPRYPALVVPI